MNLTELTDMNCEIVNTKEDKKNYKGTFRLNDKEVQIYFDQKENERFFVSSYSVGEENKGSNIIEFLKNHGLETSRNELFELLIKKI